jgi:UDP-glucose 4-epimerase
MTVLVAGGAGYIGSHVVLALRAAGRRVVVYDNLAAGSRAAVPADVPLVEGDIGDRAALAAALRAHGVDAVIHLAASIFVPESVREPQRYYRNNVANSLTLIDACLEAGVRRLVFSSTAAVYGAPDTVPIPEDLPAAPVNPYGTSKLMVEWILRDVAAAHDFHALSLRYFNVAGADAQGRAGQSTPGATHLIKVACEAAVGRRDHVMVYGEDYDTRDGTCIRDYIHVSDIAAAHVDALDHLAANDVGHLVLNCGYGRGATVHEVLDTVQRLAGTRLDIRPASRRPGDVPALVAKAERIRDLLGWRPQHDDLDTIVASALAWERKLAGPPAAAAAR